MIMAGAIAKLREDAKAPALTMANKFSKYKPESERTVRKVEVIEDETLRQLKEAWKGMPFKNRIPSVDDYLDEYYDIEKIVRQISYSSRDVGAFSIALAEFRDEKCFRHKAGFFLSALINKGSDSEYVIFAAHGIAPPKYLGCKNKKHVIVRGDVGDCCGECMEAGSITVDGNVGGFCGSHMKGGSITVNGNAKMQCGNFMKGGTIFLNGDARDIMIGNFMEGGEIHINGDYESISDEFEHGKIFHKGKLIVDK